MPEMIDATLYFDPERDVRESGVLLANRVIEAVLTAPAGAQVAVTFAGVRGAASSFFNILLYRVAQHCGVGVLDSRLHFEFSSNAQRTVFTRSFEAVKRELAPAPAPNRKSA
jgi:hypothetical protein